MSAIQNVSRREFLGGVFSTGAFVLAAQVIPRSAWAQAAPSTPRSGICCSGTTRSITAVCSGPSRIGR